MIRREAVQAGLLPGEVLDKNRIDIFKRRLSSLGYFENDPTSGQANQDRDRDRRPKDKPYGDLMIPLIGDVQQARMQDPGPGRGVCRPRLRLRPRAAAGRPRSPGLS